MSSAFTISHRLILRVPEGSSGDLAARLDRAALAVLADLWDGPLLRLRQGVYGVALGDGDPTCLSRLRLALSSKLFGRLISPSVIVVPASEGAETSAGEAEAPRLDGGSLRRMGAALARSAPQESQMGAAAPAPQRGDSRPRRADAQSGFAEIAASIAQLRRELGRAAPRAKTAAPQRRAAPQRAAAGASPERAASPAPAPSDDATLLRGLAESLAALARDQAGIREALARQDAPPRRARAEADIALLASLASLGTAIEHLSARAAAQTAALAASEKAPDLAAEMATSAADTQSASERLLDLLVAWRRSLDASMRAPTRPAGAAATPIEPLAAFAPPRGPAPAAAAAGVRA
ncbi:MAG: hypothetical protein AAGM38_04705 [Pseudomonadota bacterium]